MNKEKWILGIVLFLLGFLGVISLLSMEALLTGEATEALREQYTLNQIKLLQLINPTFLLVLAVFTGVLLHGKTSLDVPIIKGIISKNYSDQLGTILKSGGIGGLISGVLIVLVAKLYEPALSEEFLELGESIKPTVAMRLLYGGFTEEILMRFGLMTFIVWILSKATRSFSNKLYWFGLVIAALLFAAGHLPVVFQSLENPSLLVITYIMLANSLGGVVFGYLYWKKGLESAFLAHMMAHVTMLVAGLL